MSPARLTPFESILWRAGQDPTRRLTASYEIAGRAYRKGDRPFAARADKQVFFKPAHLRMKVRIDELLCD